ncbi:MAG: hypothetical protein KA855_16800, partial [Zoogloea sp.]|nr:hypothetical protein [Zoogloea sp.]
LGTAPLPVAVWLFLLPWALGMIALEELRKLLARRRLAIPKPCEDCPVCPCPCPPARGAGGGADNGLSGRG